MSKSSKKKPPFVVQYYTEVHSQDMAVEEPATMAYGSPTVLLEDLKKGLPFDELVALRAILEMPMEKLAGMLGISKATLHRRKAVGKLDVTESDRVVRYARLMGLATQVLESPENARLWLSAPKVGLGGAIPLEYAETEFGAREVEDLLGRIEYGVY